MYLATKCRNVVRGLLQAHGTEGVKKLLWNSEFAQGRWNGLDSSPGDCVYPFVETYAHGGSILDLGCGPGSTGNELSMASYADYTGVDISDVAIDKAAKRGAREGRTTKNRYFQADICTYIPDRNFNVILFRDSIYYVPYNRITALLERYAAYLTADGVFVVRLFSASGKYQDIINIFCSACDVVERYTCGITAATVLVGRLTSRMHPQPGVETRAR